MIYSPICGEKLSRLGLGTMRLPALEGGALDRQAAADLVEYALASGINLFDTAYPYYDGEAAALLGETLEQVRGEVFLSDRFSLSWGGWEHVLETQLQRLRTDHLDFYTICGSAEELEPCLESGCIDFFRRQKEQGAIRHLGFSFQAGREPMRRLCGAADWDFALLRLNYLDWKYADARIAYELCSDQGLPVIAARPMGGGLLTELGEEALRVFRVQHRDWTPAAWALRWFGDKRNVRLILTGVDSIEQLRENVKLITVRKALNGPEAMAINEVSQIIHAKLPLELPELQPQRDQPAEETPEGIDPEPHL